MTDDRKPWLHSSTDPSLHRFGVIDGEIHCLRCRTTVYNVVNAKVLNDGPCVEKVSETEELARCSAYALELRGLLERVMLEASYWSEETHAFVCAGCQYEHPYVSPRLARLAACGCACHEARCVAGLPDDLKEEDS